MKTFRRLIVVPVCRWCKRQPLFLVSKQIEASHFSVAGYGFLLSPTTTYKGVYFCPCESEEKVRIKKINLKLGNGSVSESTEKRAYLSLVKLWSEMQKP